MKRIISLILVLLTVAAVFASCGALNKKQPEENNAESKQEEQKSEEQVDPEKVSASFDVTQYYEITSKNGDKLEWKDSTLAPAKEWEGKVWRVENVTLDKGEVICILYPGDQMKKGLEAGTLLPGEELKINGSEFAFINKKQAWYVRKNEDDSYKIVSYANPKFGIKGENGKFTLAALEDVSDFVFKPVKNENAGTKYSEFISEKKNITVRLPVDVVEQVYKRVKRDFKNYSEEALKQRIQDRMQLFAESCQKTYDAEIELTGFVPYRHIIVYAYEHQDVMAGVCGNDNNIYVNVDWYVDDMEKMFRRWETGKEDYNFCVLHEMGHMFDWDRGWNFESEMETDLKASYVLYKHKDDEFGAWAAPAEYAAPSIFNIDTLDTGAYKGLSSDMSYGESGSKLRYSYSIYRAAQMYVSYVKYCEEQSNGEKGFKAMREAFHWFQDNGLKANDFTPEERFNKLNEKLTEYTGVDIEEYMLKTFRKEDWKATAANAAGKEGKRT